MCKVIAPVVSSNVVVCDEVKDFAEKYRLCVQKTASAILELACLIETAKFTLRTNKFAIFCSLIGSDYKSSYIKKLLCIAKYKDEFKKVEEKLPPNYTTIYELSKVIKSDKKEDTLIFEKLVSDDILSPRMTMKEINMVITTTKKKEIFPFVLIDFSKIDKSSRVAVLNQLKVTCRFHNLPMRQSFKIDIDNSNLIDNFFADEVNISDVEEVTH